MIVTRLLIAMLVCIGVTGCDVTDRSGSAATPKIEIRRAGGASTPTAHDALVGAVLESVATTWIREFKKQRCCFEPVGAVMISAPIDTPCGRLTRLNTPQYCSINDTLYFMDENWTQLAAAMGHYSRAAEYLVIAHEVGHAVQEQTGTFRRMMARRHDAGPAEAGRLSTENELQADCYAGIWFNDHRQELSPDDFADLAKAHQIAGDDHLATLGNRYDFTQSHGAGVERLAWFNRGFRRGDPDDCEKPQPGIAGPAAS